jgi:hypothetical protein
MKSRYGLIAFAATVALVCCGSLILGSGSASAAGEGKITGTVKFEGAPPHMRGIDMSKDPYCVKANASTPQKLETTVVGSDGGLQSVAVYIDGWTGPAVVNTTTPVFDQRNCMYVPHVMAVDPGQNFQVKTSDQTAHNIHPEPNPMVNIPWNQSQPPGAPPITKSWKNPEMIPVQCNIHPWMHGWHVVVKGPYAVTDSSGKFTIENVPPGTYTLKAWHEPDTTETAKVTVAAGQTATADFSFKK